MKQTVEYTCDEIPDALGRVVIRSRASGPAFEGYGGRIYKNVSASSLERIRRIMAGGGFVREVEANDEPDEFSIYL